LSKIVSIHLSATLDAALRRGKRGVAKSGGASGEFHELIDSYGLTPKPLFADNPDAAAEGIWHTEIPDQEAAEVVEKLLRTPGVTGAYIKPAEDLPSPP
jgi:hypothetical protein